MTLANWSWMVEGSDMARNIATYLLGSGADLRTVARSLQSAQQASHIRNGVLHIVSKRGVYLLGIQVDQVVGFISRI